MTGPLAGLKIIEMAGIGPAPMCAMLLADLGATVLRIDRREPSELGLPGHARFQILNRSRHAIAVDLKQPEGIALVLRLVEAADALIEGFRPGVMERLGLGPEPCFARNPKLIFGRMTGWGQEGPLAGAAGHDLNYIALAGVLHSIGRAGQPPTPPLNLVGDFGGGALYLAMGVLAALLEAQRSGKGQVVDAAMVDGAASLMAIFYALHAAGSFSLNRGENALDSGAFFYDVYECADGRFVSLAAIEDKFLEEFLRRMEIDPAEMPPKLDRRRWPEAKAKLATRFKTKTREEWCRLLEGSDACFAPVLSVAEAPSHPHNRARGTFIEVDGIVQPGPAPRFSRTPTALPTPPETPGARGVASLARWGIAADTIERLKSAGVLG
jgi:alpha-methylacyl-CoA racemase